jgi:HK97 family phage portal protein
VYERTVDGRTKVDTPLWYLLNESPSPAWTAATMFEWWARCNALRGDAVSQIQRDRNGNATGFLQWHPDRVQIETKAGQLHYYFQPKDGKAFGLFADDVLHIPGEGFNGEHSLSVIQHAAHQSIGIALAADDFSGKFYRNGASPKHLITAPGKMDEPLIEQLKNQYGEKYTGPENVGKPMVLTEGLKIEQLSMSAVDAELLESRKYQVIDIARAFGIPPFMIGAQETSTSWGTGIEQQTLGFVKFTLQAYLNRIEQELNRKLFATPKYFVEFNLDGLLRGDSKAESEYLRQAIGGSQGPGWMTANEVRRLKNQPPIAGGDTRYVPKGNDDAQEAPAATA